MYIKLCQKKKKKNLYEYVFIFCNHKFATRDLQASQSADAQYMMGITGVLLCRHVHAYVIHVLLDNHLGDISGH